MQQKRATMQGLFSNTFTSYSTNLLSKRAFTKPQYGRQLCVQLCLSKPINLWQTHATTEAKVPLSNFKPSTHRHCRSWAEPIPNFSRHAFKNKNPPRSQGDLQKVSSEEQEHRKTNFCYAGFWSNYEAWFGWTTLRNIQVIFHPYIDRQKKQ